MSQLILEGKWEEIAAHADELAGKDVRLIVVERPASLNGNHPRTEERPLAELLEGLVGVIDSSQPWPEATNTPERGSDAFGEGVIEKLTKQGLRLP